MRAKLRREGFRRRHATLPCLSQISTVEVADMVSVLHISDLHRDSGSRLTTASLLESLRLDRDRYVGEGLRSPDLAIVSGDIVYGVTSNDANSDAALKRQYDEALEFLVRLADLFFEGNRERVILVPGNHDVSHPHVLRATEIEAVPAEKDQRQLVAKQLAAEGAVWRWVWSDFVLRRVTKPLEYRDRLKPFADFFETFYEGHHAFSLDSEEQFVVHDLPEFGIVVVGLSSCCDNDLFNRAGRIHPDCIAGATRGVASLARAGRLPIAVWHHNLSGGPRDSDYVDAEFLQSLMDGGFVMGLHGHQHRPQFIEHRFTADRQKALAVVSAGTLCGGPNSLPTGRRRAYNLILIDPLTGASSVHVREMKNGEFGLPVWGAAFVPEFNGPTIDFKLQMPPREKIALQAASEAAELLRKGDRAGAFALVRGFPEDDFARRVALQALQEADDWPGIVGFCNPPRSNLELIAVFEALYQVGDRPGLRELTQSQDVTKNADAAVRQCVDQALARLGGSK